MVVVIEPVPVPAPMVLPVTLPIFTLPAVTLIPHQMPFVVFASTCWSSD